ncbi:asparagine synthase-related protein [Falsirhodobacter xinxiangensis]|uniref:asparagine synthase-related protein n=1 Tax=Falsirhodobacter xinxiangensis TaxID=2530049 RepID=UPI0010AA6FD1|nr:asparagine synthase-related protein [Rhodobacter xinxiangensis]
MSTFVAFSFKKPVHVSRTVEKAVQICRDYLPSIYSSEPEIWIGKKSALVVWPTRGEQAAMSRRNGLVLGITGYTTVLSPQGILDRVRTSSSGLFLDQSPGGVAAFCLIDQSERLFAWSTQPPVHGLYTAQTRAEYTVVAPRPLLAYLASTRSAAIRLRRDYAFEMLASGYAIGSTPYADTRRNPVMKGLLVQDGDPTPIDHPHPRHPVVEGSLNDVARQYREKLETAVSVAGNRDVTLRLSGGKDSRTILAIAHGTGMNISAVTMGAPDSGEAQTAARVAEACGFRHEIRPQQVIADPIRAACLSHMATEGLITAVPHQFAHTLDPPRDGGLVMTGQGHLQRGGYAPGLQSASWDATRAIRYLKTKVRSGLVTEDLNAPNLAAVDAWAAERGRGTHLSAADVLHWGSADFRLGYWYASTFMAMEGITRPLMPLLDDAVFAFVAATGAKERMSEKMNFAMISNAAPRLGKLGLYNDRWRFELDGADAEIPGYGDRTPLPKSKSNAEGLVFDENPHRFRPTTRTFCAATLDSATWHDIKIQPVARIA